MKNNMGWLATTLFLGACVVGCADGGKGQESTGTLALPLVTNGSSGVSYRLRNANFTISPYNYYYYYGAAGAAGAGNPPTVTVSSESDPNAATIDVDVQSGYYNVNLQSGWSMEMIEGGVSTPVEAQLLSAQSQWLSVSAHSTSWVRYQFGIGGHALWFNGDVNIDMEVYETPDQYYGGAGSGNGSAGYGAY